jgi:hypothetical protein
LESKHAAPLINEGTTPESSLLSVTEVVHKSVTVESVSRANFLNASGYRANLQVFAGNQFVACGAGMGIIGCTVSNKFNHFGPIGPTIRIRPRGKQLDTPAGKACRTSGAPSPS